MKTGFAKCLVYFLLILASLVSGCAFCGERIVTGRLIISQSALRPGDRFELAFCGIVKPGYHIGSAGSGSLYPAKLTIKAPDTVVLDQPIYPRGRIVDSSGRERVPTYEGKFVIRLSGRVKDLARPGKVHFAASFEYQGCKQELCLPPEVFACFLTVPLLRSGSPVKPINTDVFGKKGKSTELTSTEQRFAERLESYGLLLKLLMLYAFGLLLAFTPCVYPMIPVTLGYFCTQGEYRNRRVILMAAVYVLGIAFTYSVLGTLAAATGGVFGGLMQNRWVLAGIATVLVVLALSMFGLYEIRPPAFIEERASGRSGIAGAFLMGLVFGIVAAPCVGPAVLGLMLYVAKLGKPAMGFLLFFVLALGIGTPLFLLATLSAKLPAAGMWMLAVRKLAGFLLLGAAAYFASLIVPGHIRGYLVPGVAIVAGIYFALFERSLQTNRVLAVIVRVISLLVIAASLAVVLHSGGRRHMLTWHPYSLQALKEASRKGVPVIVDFTADWCAACKELEHKTFSDPRVIREASRFRRLRVDATNASDSRVLAATRRHSVKGFPTVIFFDSTGKELSENRVVGFVSADEFLALLRRVR